MHEREISSSAPVRFSYSEKPTSTEETQKEYKASQKWKQKLFVGDLNPKQTLCGKGISFQVICMT